MARPVKSSVKPDNVPVNRPSQAEKARTPWGERIIDRLDGKNQSWLARAADVDQSTLSDIVARAMPKADSAVRIAAALDTTVEWLLTGTGPRSRRLFDADEADWVMLPRYDPRRFGERGKGEPIERYPIRLDWLNRHARSSKDLWVTEMPKHYFDDDAIEEGDTILCRDVAQREGLGYFLYLFDGAPVVRHFTLPARDAQLADAQRIWDLSALASDPEGMRVIARILGSIKLMGV